MTGGQISRVDFLPSNHDCSAIIITIYPLFSVFCVGSEDTNYIALYVGRGYSPSLQYTTYLKSMVLSLKLKSLVNPGRIRQYHSFYWEWEKLVMNGFCQIQKYVKISKMLKKSPLNNFIISIYKKRYFLKFSI